MTIYRPDNLLENDIDQMVGEPLTDKKEFHIVMGDQVAIWSWDSNGVAWRTLKDDDGTICEDRCADNTYTYEDAETTIIQHLVIVRAVHHFLEDPNDDIETED